MPESIAHNSLTIEGKSSSTGYFQLALRSANARKESLAVSSRVQHACNRSTFVLFAVSNIELPSWVFHRCGIFRSSNPRDLSLVLLTRAECYSACFLQYCLFEASLLTHIEIRLSHKRTRSIKYIYMLAPAMSQYRSNSTIWLSTLFAEATGTNLHGAFPTEIHVLAGDTGKDCQLLLALDAWLVLPLFLCLFKLFKHSFDAPGVMACLHQQSRKSPAGWKDGERR